MAGRVRGTRVATIRVAGLVGSLRQGSYNRALLRAAMALQPEGMEIVDVDLRALPHYDDDLEHAGESAEIRAFKGQIAAADALLFVTPEYNYSIPGILKDAIDWGSRPQGQGPLRQKPVAIMGCATGLTGTRRAQLHLRSICTALDLWDMKKPEITVAGAAEKFDAAGILTDPEIRDQLSAFLEAFAVWIGRFRT
jgi:chromate reductase